MEKLEDLGILNYKIYQDDSLYKFTSDAVLLTRFASVKNGDIVADFCSGSGIVGLHLFALNPKKIDSVTLFEMQKPLFDLSNKTININNLTDKFCAVNCKVQDVDKSYFGKFSLIVCNPPYRPVGAGEMDEKDTIAVCRHEIALTLKELVCSISKCLKFGGRTCIVHRADRLAEVFYAFREYGIEPKRMQLISAKNKEPYLVLIEGVKGGKSGLKVLSNLLN